MDGVICSANEGFRHVFGHDWAELIGSPQIMRHPSMPRAAFRLMWNRIQAGAAVGVYAVAASMEDGYFSIR